MKQIINNLSYANKIRMLPVIAAVAFLVLIGLSWYSGYKNRHLLDTVEYGHYSSLEMNQTLFEHINNIHRNLQDAVVASEEDPINEARTLAGQSQELLLAGKDNLTVDQQELKANTAQFEEYIALAVSSTQALVRGDMSAGTMQGIQRSTALNAELLEKLTVMIARDKESVVSAFGVARDTQSGFNQVIIVSSFLALAILFATSYYIIRIAMATLRSVANGMDKLSSGDLSENEKPLCDDELGSMVNQVSHVKSTVQGVTGEIQMLIDAVRNGELDKRGDANKFHGAYAELVEGVNQLIQAFAAPIDTTSSYLSRISSGDIPSPIEEEYRGSFNDNKLSLNGMIDTVDMLISEVGTLTKAARAGDLNQRANESHFSGSWLKLIQGINRTLDAVSEPVYEVSDTMSAIAEGDLSRRMDNQYEGTFAKLQFDTNATIEKLTEVIGSIVVSADEVSSAALDINQGNSDLSRSVEVQVSSLEETRGQLSEMTRSTNHNAENAVLANEKVSEAQNVAHKGGEVVSRTCTAMEQINDASQKMAGIISVIDEIAFQTNLLALNASVEAARAGEQGKGFAVVASEVRNLAGRSSTAAKEIADIIKDCVEKAADGLELVNESGSALTDIVETITETVDLVKSISEASTQQSLSIEEIDKAMSEIDRIAAANSQLADQTQTSGTSLDAEAARLQELVKFFVLAQQAEGGQLQEQARIA